MKAKLNLTLILLITSSLLLAGCTQANEVQLSGQEVSNTGKNQVTAKQEKTWQQVTVRYLDFEGGFYGLVSKTGDKLLPMNLAKEYQLPGTVLKVKGQFIQDLMTIQQWGQPFKITDVELIKLGKANTGETF